MSLYEHFLASKTAMAPATGIEPTSELSRSLFSFQQDLVRWALRRGRAALFCDTGLGKTRMQLEWAKHVHQHTGKDVLILAPLAVAAQTKREGEAIGIDAHVCRSHQDVGSGINVTNYERLHLFDASAFGAVVLDESSIIKHYETKTLKALLEAFSATPFRLCCTATPAPNDHTELGTHAEFLGVCKRTEMLAEFFCHDGGETQVWRLKGHARKPFWAWVSSWAALVRSPSDLGYDMRAYELPPLSVEKHEVGSGAISRKAGFLFPVDAKTLDEQRKARRASLPDRVAACAAMVNSERDAYGMRASWIVWAELNDESRELAAAIDGAVEITGSDDADVKEQRLLDFLEGRSRVLVSKPSIAGFGLNMQFCSRMAFVGATNSYESYYQAIRRCWRFGQKFPVRVHIFCSPLDGAVVRNLERKGEAARVMADELSIETREMVKAQVLGAAREAIPYTPEKAIILPEWMSEAS